jgi:hypothetical protein
LGGIFARLHGGDHYFSIGSMPLSSQRLDLFRQGHQHSQSALGGSDSVYDTFENGRREKHVLVPGESDKFAGASNHNRAAPCRGEHLL